MRTENCIEWDKSRNIKNGNRLDYGQVRVGNKMMKAHRVAWVKAFGEIPQGMLVLHRCDNPSCVNPDHLFLGTHSDNAKDREQKNRGRHLVGSSNGNTKISEQTAVRIKMLSGVLSASFISRVLGLSANQVCLIMNGVRWSNINAQTRYTF